MSSTSKICKLTVAPIKLTIISAIVPLLLWGEVGHSLISEWRKNPPASVERGDLVFRKDNGVWSKFFINASKCEKRFSHTGIIDGVSGGVPTIIHADADERTGVGCVRRQRWGDFFNESVDGAVYRFNGTNDEREKIAVEAERRIGVHFDTGFDMWDKKKLYCSELIRDAVNAAVNREVIGYTTVADCKTLVAVDDCYKAEMSLVAECDVTEMPEEIWKRIKVLIRMLCMGVSLAIACGFSTTLPVLVLSIGVCFLYVPIGSELLWFESINWLLAFAILSCIELFLFRIAIVNSLLDIIEVPLSMICGIFVVACSMHDVDVIVRWMVAGILGSGITGWGKLMICDSFERRMNRTKGNATIELLYKRTPALIISVIAIPCPIVGLFIAVIILLNLRQVGLIALSHWH